MPPLRPLRQGTEEQRLATPHIGARHKSLLLQFKSHAAQGRKFSGSRLDARASFKLSYWLELGLGCS